MCNPIIIGVATGLMSAVQSIAGYQAQSQAASASERAYQEQRNLNQEAANRAYQQTQLKMKGEMEKASQQAEQGLVLADWHLDLRVLLFLEYRLVWHSRLRQREVGFLSLLKSLEQHYPVDAPEPSFVGVNQWLAFMNPLASRLL
jgi:hypothetical protein